MVHHDSLRICIKHSIYIYLKIFNNKDIENYFTKYKKYFTAHLLRHLTFRLTLCFQKFLVVSLPLCFWDEVRSNLKSLHIRAFFVGALIPEFSFHGSKTTLQDG